MTRFFDTLGWVAVGLFVAVKIAVWGSFAFEQVTGRAPQFIAAAQGAERCVLGVAGGDSGHDCSDAGFAWAAAEQCPNLAPLFERTAHVRCAGRDEGF